MKKKLLILLTALVLVLTAVLLTPSTRAYDCTLSVNGKDYPAQVRLKVPTYKLLLHRIDGTMEVQPAGAIEGWAPAHSYFPSDFFLARFFESLFVDKDYYEFFVEPWDIGETPGLLCAWASTAIYANQTLGMVSVSGTIALSPSLDCLALDAELHGHGSTSPLRIYSSGGEDLLARIQNNE